MLDAKKKRSSEAIAKADDLKRELSCLDECNKKLVEESGKMKMNFRITRLS